MYDIRFEVEREREREGERETMANVSNGCGGDATTFYKM